MRKLKITDILVKGATLKVGKVNFAEQETKSFFQGVRATQSQILKRRTIDESQLKEVVKR